VTIIGHLLGRVAFVKANIELLLVGIVDRSVNPIGVEPLPGRRRTRTSGSGPS
jgi:membrane-associated protein